MALPAVKAGSTAYRRGGAKPYQSAQARGARRVPVPRTLAGVGRDLGFALPPSTGFQAIALAVPLEDVDVVREPIEEGPGQPLRAEHGRPLVEGQVAGDQDRATLVAPAEDLEQELRPARRQRPGAAPAHGHDR